MVSILILLQVRRKCTKIKEGVCQTLRIYLIHCVVFADLIHFKGVCTVVAKFFNIINLPMRIFGEKDAQQLAIIRKMVFDLNFPVNIVGVPIVRENDGLAKSSRNTYLSSEERKAATILYKAIQLGNTNYTIWLLC